MASIEVRDPFSKDAEDAREFSRSLEGAGFQVEGIIQPPPKGFRVNLPFSPNGFGSVHPNLTMDTAPFMLLGDRPYFIHAKLHNGERQFDVWFNGQEEVILGTTLHLPPAEITPQTLHPTLVDFRFQYDLTADEQAKQALATIASKRLPKEAFFYSSPAHTRVSGIPSDAGLDIEVDLVLQDPNPESHLKCYEVEIYPDKNGLGIFLRDTSDIAPESIWQEQEGHCCMLGENGYPFIPVPVDKIGKFTMMIQYFGNDRDFMLGMLGELPLSLSGSNTWVAEEMFGIGSAVLFNPDWGEQNTAVVYRSGWNHERISPNQVKGYSQGLMDVIASMTS